MQLHRQIAYASVAHRYRVGQLLGSNLCLEATVACDSPGPGSAFTAEIAARLKQIKMLVDHQCLFTHIPRFESAPSTAETIALYLAEELFKIPLSQGKWHALRVAETSTLAAQAGADGSLELCLKVLNLELRLRGPVNPETGVMSDRDYVLRVVHSAFFKQSTWADANSRRQPAGQPAAWGRQLFAFLKHSLPQLHSVTLDLGGQEYQLKQETV